VVGVLIVCRKTFLLSLVGVLIVCRKTFLLSLIGCVGRLRIKKRENDLCWFGTLLFGGFGMLGTTKFSRIKPQFSELESYIHK
jgi:hypothetical protein